MLGNILLMHQHLTAFNKKKIFFIRKMNLLLRKKLVNCYVWSTTFHGAYTWTLRKVDQKYLESFEMWCWRRMEKINWNDRVSKEEVLYRVKVERNILQTIHRRKATWIGHILRRNCLLKYLFEGKIEGRM
jgi:hypothetical protein